MATRWNRRQFLTTTAAAAALLPRGAFAQQAGPWTQRPPGNPGSVNFVVWQYGKIYEQIAKQFEDDWGVKVQQIIEPNVEPQVAKLTAMFAANEPVDVSQSPMQYLASYIEQGVAQPIDGLPGVDQYIKDFTPFTRAIAQRDGKTWGLPYFSTVWTFMYNDELLGKAGLQGQAVQELPRAGRAGEEGEEGRRVEVSDPLDRRPGLRAAARHVVQHGGQPRRRHLRQAAGAAARRRLDPARDAASGGRPRSRTSWPIRARSISDSSRP